MAYSSSVITFTEVTTAGSVIQPAYFTDPYTEIVAIEQGLLNGFQHALKFLTDNTYDIGASGANRPRSIYPGTALIAPGTNPAASGFLRFPNNPGTIAAVRNAGNTADIAALGLDGSGNTIVGVGLVDVNSKNWIGQTATPLAVDYLNVVNGAAGNPGVVILQALGTDANIELDLTPKGTANVKITTNGISVATTAQTGTANRFRMLQSMASVHLSAAVQSIPNITSTALSFDVADVNTDGMYSSVQPTRLTAPITGKYVCSAGVSFASNSTGTIRALWFRKNGSTTYTEFDVAPRSGGPQNIGITSPILLLSATDYVEVLAYQDSGGALNAVNIPGTFFSMLYVGE